MLRLTRELRGRGLESPGQLKNSKNSNVLRLTGNADRSIRLVKKISQ